jgi:glycosyltransferase involved in cell wall biosynthesis
MKLGLDARLFYNNTGIGRYTRSLFFEYHKAERFEDHPLVLLSDTHLSAPSSPNFAPLDGQARDAWPEHVKQITADCRRRILWTNWHVPPLLRQHDVDVYHAVCNFELPLRKVCRYVVTIHDLVPLFFSKSVPKKHLLFFRLFMKRAAHTADLIITDSEHSKQDIVQHLRVPEEKIRVIYLGYDPPQEKAIEPQKAQNILKRYGVRTPYLLFVGAIEPKKNLERVVEAFRIVRERYAQDKELQLVLVGGESWMSDALYRKVSALKRDQQVLLTGFVPDAELPAFYQEAEVFVFPSLYEGFGLPVLEAMSYGTPVVTSNVSSLPEIAGDAAILTDPQQADSISDGIARVLMDRSKREDMKRLGKRQAQKFSWKKCAEETWQVYLDAMTLS